VRRVGGKVAARVPSYYATLLSLCFQCNVDGEGVVANARALSEGLLLQATRPSIMRPTVHAQILQYVRLFQIPGSTAVVVVREGAWSVGNNGKLGACVLEGRAPRSSSRRGKSLVSTALTTTLTCQHSRPTRPAWDIHLRLSTQHPA
jgi:hypothetical protein